MVRHKLDRNTDRECFSSGNDWGIPDLLPDKLSSKVPDGETRFMVYRTMRLTRDAAKGNILGFFVDDYRFACCWSYPARMLASLLALGCCAVCEPDFSLWTDRPLAEQLHAVYRTRWCGRYWQEHGIDVIPVLNWSDERSYSLAWLGIPSEPPVAAVECRTCGDNHDAFNRGLAAAVAAVRPRKLIIYGERKSWVDVPVGTDAVWVEPVTNKRFDEMRRRTPLG